MGESMLKLTYPILTHDGQVSTIQTLAGEGNAFPCKVVRAGTVKYFVSILDQQGEEYTKHELAEKEFKKLETLIWEV